MSRLRCSITHLKKLNKGGKVEKDADMSKYCTFRCGGKAKVLLEINTLENFFKVMDYILVNNVPYFVLGAGSNLLVSDEVYKGVIIKLGGTLAITEQTGDYTFDCGAGVRLSQLFRESYKCSCGGLEDGAGIPATIGGAVYMNASAYTFETKNIVEYVVAWVDGKVKYFDNPSCQFGYRESVFQKNNAIILRVGVRLKKSTQKDILLRFQEVSKKRRSSQPLDYPSAGSVFKRVDSIQVSKLLDEAGLKGLTIGGAQVSTKHANFIINTGNATAQDVYQLVNLVKIKVKDKYNIDLKTEIKFLGDFE